MFDGGLVHGGLVHGGQGVIVKIFNTQFKFMRARADGAESLFVYSYIETTHKKISGLIFYILLCWLDYLSGTLRGNYRPFAADLEK